MRIRALFPKQPTTPMHLLALIGRNGIGRLGYSLPEHPPAAPAPPMSRDELLQLPFTPRVFAELIRAYLSTGAGIAGVQPKIMVPDRATVPMPSLIVKAAGPSYPALAANEYLCLSAARKAGITTPQFELGIEIGLEAGPWHAMVAAAESGRIDGLMLSAPLPERRDRFLFTEDFDAIYHDWMSIRYRVEADRGLLLRVVAEAALLLAIIGWWAFSLAREVSRRRRAEAALAELCSIYLEQTCSMDLSALG